MNKTLSVKRGDIWEFTTNNGMIVRHVKSVASGVVSYLNKGRFYQCQLSTFSRWANGAELTFREEPDVSRAVAKAMKQFDDKMAEIIGKLS